jgi:c(7)-type cytochrome triheme protein
MKMRKITIQLTIFLSVMVLITMAYSQSGGLRKKRPAHHEYSNVVLNNVSEKNNIAPVVFNHWLHRAKYTCRLCHIDLKFAMTAGATGISENANNQGLYCGACHNGKEAFAPVKKGTSGESIKKNCDRCHSYGQKVKFETNFYLYTKGFPRGRFGNGIDWLKAEQQGKVTLKDHLEGVSPEKKQTENPDDAVLKPTVGEMPEIIFSHKKHAVWNGCELCHPVIFSEKKGENKFTMAEIFEGKYCGTCHGTVSFSTLDCRRCHVKRVL